MSTMARHVALAAAAAAVVAACYRAPPAVTPAGDLAGRYTFEENLPAPSVAGSETVAGELEILPDSSAAGQSGAQGLGILPDSFTVDSREGPCRRPNFALPSDPTVVEFTCPDFSVQIDRRQPLRKTTYSVTLVETVHRTECVQYGSDKDGNRICVQTSDRMEQQKVGRTGPLHFHSVRN